MKDYSLITGIKDESADFILRYEVVSDEVVKKEIVVHYTSFKKKSFPYSLEKEKEILNQMKEQFLKHRFCMENELWDEQQRNRVYGKFIEISTIVTLFGGCFSFLPEEALSNNGKLFLTLGILGLVVSVPNLIINKLIVNDYKKSKLFLENEEYINESLLDEDIKNKVKKCLRDMFVSNDEEVCINFNFIDKLSLKQLRCLLYLIEKEKNVQLINELKEKEIQYKK